MEGSERRKSLGMSGISSDKNKNKPKEESYVVNINSEIYKNIHNSDSTRNNTDSEPFDFNKVIEEEFSNQNNFAEESEFLTSDIKGKSSVVKSKHRLEPNHGGSNFISSDFKREEGGSGVRIHQEMEYKLAHIYHENPLTIVSEERSIQMAEVSNPSHNQSSNRQKNEYLVEFDKNNGYKYRTNSGYGMESENKGMLFGDMLAPTKPGGRLAQSHNPELYSPLSFESGRLKNGKGGQKNDYQMPHMYDKVPRIDSEGRKFDLETKKQGNMIVSKNQRFRTNSEGGSNNLIAQFKFGNKDDSRTQSSIRIKDRPVNLHVEPHINEKFVKERFKNLPVCPLPPNYLIEILRFVSNKKEIQKKQSLVEDLFVKINYDLYYNGDIRYGKLCGKGIVFLKAVDTSQKNNLEYKKNLLFEGQFAENKVNGKGKLYFQNGVYFEGNFSNGLAHGPGTLYGSSGNIIVTGIWLDGKFDN